jgi:hypothetical protein
MEQYSRQYAFQNHLQGDPQSGQTSCRSLLLCPTALPAPMMRQPGCVISSSWRDTDISSQCHYTWVSVPETTRC